MNSTHIKKIEAEKNGGKDGKTLYKFMNNVVHEKIEIESM